MNIDYGGEVAGRFVTNVGLISSFGKNGSNIMACEWTHLLSYSPGLVGVCIGKGKLTAENIRQNKQFGISIASVDQTEASSASGMPAKINKIEMLKELGFEIKKGKKTSVVLVGGAALNIECELVKEIELGDHIMFVGEIVAAEVGKDEPLAYHKGRYWKMSEPLKKPSDEERVKFDRLVKKHTTPD